jgi:hypothetical protein
VSETSVALYSADIFPPLPDRAVLLSAVQASEAALPSAEIPHVVVCAEDTGGTYALLPVLHELHARNVGTTVLAAAHGAQILQERGSEYGFRVDALDGWPPAAEQPGALLLGPSVSGRLEYDLRSRFPLAPAFVVEDYYESSRGSIEHAAKVGLPPPTVCVIDDEAKLLIERRFPGLPVPVEITGSPAFDTLADEDTVATQTQRRAEIGILPDKKLVAFFIPSLGRASLRLTEQAADAFRRMGSTYIFAPRRHPSDSNGWNEYERLLDGVPTLTTVDIPSDTVADAADLVVGHRSGTILREVVRQRLTITLNAELNPGFTFPLVDAGASMPAHPTELDKTIPELLDGSSARTQLLRQNMLPYKTDGQAAARVAQVVCRAISG